MNIHPTVPVIIDGQAVDIDVDIVPVVNWLNSLPGIRTQYSCQGDESNNTYVLVLADSADCLSPILEVLRQDYIPAWHGETPVVRRPNVEVAIDYFYLAPRYMLSWESNGHLKEFIRRCLLPSCGKSSCRPCATTADPSVCDFTVSGTGAFAR